jgi:hypothetical protein
MRRSSQYIAEYATGNPIEVMVSFILFSKYLIKRPLGFALLGTGTTAALLTTTRPANSDTAKPS